MSELEQRITKLEKELAELELRLQEQSEKVLDKLTRDIANSISSETSFVTLTKEVV